MSNNRKKYSEAQNVSLVSQVDGLCPVCLEPLFYKKSGKSFKNYDIAHIYPLNPTVAEKKLLANEERLSNDVNNENNVIPLCKSCHKKFDNPRTIEEYRYLLNLKKTLIRESSQKELWKVYTIEEELTQIIEEIYESHDPDFDVQIDFKTKKVDSKLDDTISRPTKRKVKNNVRDYYVFLKNKFASMSQVNVDISEIISYQIKAYYLKQNQLGISQQEIFENIVLWVHSKTKPKTNDAAEILVSFFIQNCEVF